MQAVLGYRFRRCSNIADMDSFFEELSSLSLLDTTAASSFSVEPKPSYSEPEPPKLNEFKRAIEISNYKGFDEFIDENPRFLLNTTNDGPTLLQGSQR